MAGGTDAAALSHAELEDQLDARGQELLRRMFQDHLSLRAMTERRLAGVRGAQTRAYGAVETGHHRPLATVFGEVEVTRLAYRRRGRPNLYPADAALNVPAERHSHGLRRLAATEASRGGVVTVSVHDLRMFRYRERMSVMNGGVLVQAVVSRFRDLGVEVTDSGGGSSLTARIPVSSGVLGARIELHEGEGAVAPPRGAGQPVILAQRYVPTGLGSRYRKAGVPYIDSGGNAWLSFPGFVTQVQGREPAYVLRPGKDRPSRAFRSTGLRVVFALLTQPGLVSATVRRIAAASTVSVGAAQAALHDLRAEGFLHDGHDRARTMTDEGKLAHRWVAGYGTELGPRLSAVELVGPGPKWWMKQDGLDVAAQGQVGGEAALAVLGYGIRPLTTTLYGDEPWHGLRRVGRLRRGADSNVILRERFWTPPEAGTGVLVPRLLTYADAVASDDPRQMEVAEQMRRTDEELRCLSHGG